VLFHVCIAVFRFLSRRVTIQKKEFFTGCAKKYFARTGERISIEKQEKKIFIDQKIL